MRNAHRRSVGNLFRCAFVALALTAGTIAHALTQDISTQFAIVSSASAPALNRATNTYDRTFFLKNTSGAPVLAPIAVVVGGLPAGVTLVNQSGTWADGRPYLSPMTTGSILQNGGTLSFTLKFANPQGIKITSMLQVLYTVEIPLDAPVLIAAVALDATHAYVVGRVSVAANQSIALQASTAATCVLGTLVGAATVGGPVAAMTDASGYFGVTVAGVSPGAFVTLRQTSPTASPSSLCQVSTRDNDSWPKAFLLDGTTPSASDFIDSPGKARWYKIAITPDQRIQATISNLGADYDLVVFKDIGQAFLNQFNPATANANDLTKLTAEYAPSTFSPSTFSPSTFSPDAYAPSTFSPSTFSSSVFSPSTFSPSTFSPSTFSPSTFSPSTFSTQAFNPSTFSPSTFSPSVFSATEIAQAFSTAQTRSVIAVSATPGTGNESAVVNTWNNTGYFYVRVTGRSGAFNTSRPFNLDVVKGPTTCTGVTDTTLASRPSVSATGRTTVILTDSSKVALDDTLVTSAGGTLRERLSTFAARADIKGVLVDVAADARVSQLKQQAADNPACPFAKNLVAREIKAIVDSYRANPLRYIVIVGNDDAIPFFRSPDQSQLGQESSFVPPVQSNSPSEASLRRDFVLSQDAYGSMTTLSLATSDFPLPGLAVGRLIESAAEIAGILDAYVAANGAVAPSTSLVTGYDFLEDAANAVRTELQLGTGTVSDALITPNGKSPQDPASWTAAQLNQMLLGSRHDVIFLAGHFSANSALAADFATSLLTTDVAASTVDLTNAIVFSAGCHSGYNLVDVDAIPGVTMSLDWAQTFARKKATLIAGTGYQYGDTDFVEYGERLYRNLARLLRAGTGPVAIGEALVRAKLDYLATTTDIRGIHEKTLLEATLFGLPMLGVNMPAGRGAVPGTPPVITPTPVGAGPAATLGLKTYSLAVAPSLAPASVALKNVQGGPDVLASWLTGPDGVVAKPGEPVLPLAAINITPTDPTVVLRGVGFRGGTYVDSAPLLPFSGAPTTELRGVHVPFASPVFYPGRMWNPNYFGVMAGSGGTQLLVTPAQNRIANIAAGTSTQRRFTGLDLRLYYSGNLTQAALSDAPEIVAVEDLKDGGDVLFTVQVVGNPAAAIYQVWITYTAEGINAWASLDLNQCVAPLAATCAAEDSRLWKGRLVGAPANLKYVVQAVSGVGLVALDDNAGAYYGIGAATPAATTLELVSPPTVAAVGDSVAIKVKLAAGVAIAGKSVLIAIGGVAQVGTTAADGTVTINAPVNATPGSYSITASFAGDDDFLPSSATSPFQVNRATSTLVGLAPAGVTLTGTLGGRTEALQAEAVSFSVTGPAGPTTIWVNTNVLGQALLPPPGLPAGNYTVNGASFGGNATFAPATITVAPGQQFAVARIAQNIAFGTLQDVAYGSPEFEVYATASSGLPVSFAASGACSVTRNLVQANGVGGCTVTASQDGDAVYAPATTQSRTFTVTRANQVIAFAPPPVGVTAGQPLVTFAASSSSPTAPPSLIPLVFASQTPSICTSGGINGANLTLVAAGTCIIAANQAGNALYNPAPQTTMSFTVGAAGAPPTTFTVTTLADSGAGSLRAAITSANAAAGPNIINFSVTGTITLTTGQIQISGPLQINGPGAGLLTINGNAGGRIFSIFATDPACPALDGPDYLVAIAGVRLTNARRNVAGSSGGAIFTEHSLALDSVVIDNSFARGGGGVMFSIQYPGQTLTISNSRFLNNSATEVLPAISDTSPVAGGALLMSERCQNALDTPHTVPVTVTIAGSEFRDNSALPLTNHDGRGGAIRSYSRADISITDTIIADNGVLAPSPPPAGFVYRGGGAEFHAKSLLIERSEISQNDVTDVTATDTTRSGGLHLSNSAEDLQGAGNASAMKIVNSTISGNFASDTCGAMAVVGNVALELDNSTVSNNVASLSRTGGICFARTLTYPSNDQVSARPTFTLVSSIVANNNGTGADVAATPTGGFLPTFTIYASSSLIEKLCPAPGCNLFVSGTGNRVGPCNDLPACFDPLYPLLGPLQANGGPTRTHALLPGSPAINTGSNPLGLTTDQRGTGFPRVNGGSADMGAYESP